MIDRVTVSVSGPLADYSAFHAVQDFLEEATREVGMQGLANVHRLLDVSLRKPTPYYETQVVLEQRAVTDWAVHDRGTIYGPWLEGTGSRNRTTSFKGYRSFRFATQELSRQAPGMAERVLQQYLPRMGGS
ncbi:MAG TPA: hypothetical protein VGD67_12140 [Pseudonocardiaceae bacterium]